MKFTLMAGAALCALSLASPSLAWNSANDGGRLRYFVNGGVDVNLRAWPNPSSQILAKVVQDTQMSADRCIHPQGLKDDWCHVAVGNSAGWVDAANLQEVGRQTAPPTIGYAAPTPVPPAPSYDPHDTWEAMLSACANDPGHKESKTYVPATRMWQLTCDVNQDDGSIARLLTTNPTAYSHPVNFQVCKIFPGGQQEACTNMLTTAVTCYALSSDHIFYKTACSDPAFTEYE
jgi:hypothetical protein